MIAFRFPRIFSVWTLVGICLAGAGCGGGSDGPRTIPISGKVTYKGEPVKNGQINFFPETGQEIRGTQANTQEDGVFQTPPGKGLMVGRYKVSVQAYKGPVNDPASEAPPGGMAKTAKTGDSELAVPKKYASPDTSGLTVAVEASDSSKTLDLELTD